ncbi:TIGR03089 family protein [Arthrobacter sp. GMC3]|uniref:TIGR03089 family protein n=1 Tax=Arthrobacter sp. GMC3 TaxID=2058894 RepID=UPI000CE2DA38|nr:TIGR03089 family protein [Arthrobacter sp. GMC3]
MAQPLRTIENLLNAFRTQNATSPRLTWYGPDSERVELSGRVLENWVAKTANYLVDELDAEPGTVVAVDMPVHWRSLVWLLASWAVGATALPQSPPDAGSRLADIVVTTRPAEALAASNAAGRLPFVVAVALPALAMRWIGELPADALDYSGGVRAHSDVFFADAAPSEDAAAWESQAGAVTYAELLAAEGATAGPERILLQAADGWDAVVRASLRIWAAGGSVVLLDPTVPATDHLRTVENVTAG